MATKASLYTQTPMGDGSWTNTWETYFGWRGINQGTAMKSKNTPINSINPQGDSKPASSDGFDQLLAGYAHIDLALAYGNDGYLWSSSSGASSGAWVRHVFSGNADVYRSNYLHYFLFSVRCKKDTN